MSFSYRDYVQPGQYYTADYLRVSNLDESTTFQTMYQLCACNERTASDPGVISLTTEFDGAPDTSRVFRIQERNPQEYTGTWEFTTSQTGTLLIPAPGVGKRIVLNYGSIRTESVSGDAYFQAGTFITLKIYFSNQSSFSAGAIIETLPENQPVLLYSTQGAKRLFAALIYNIEAI